MKETDRGRSRLYPLIVFTCVLLNANLRAEQIENTGGERQGARALPGIGVRASTSALEPSSQEPIEFVYGPLEYARVHFWWNGIPPETLGHGLRNGRRSNIAKPDYAGPQLCQQCHAANYEKWQSHSHRLMNAVAGPETVVGDFYGTATMDYLGGKARFYQENGTNYMRLDRDNVTRIYAVYRTIGSRFFQYYAGRLVSGPEPADHSVRLVDHVLPLGYLITYKQWMPIIHIDAELPDGKRADAFAGPSDIPYDRSCSVCHTTWPIGDWLLSSAGMPRAQYYSPYGLDFNASDYLHRAHPDIFSEIANSGVPKTEWQSASLLRINAKPVQEHGVALGVTCEACHNGAKAHAENSTPDHADVNPLFFPSAPEVSVHAPSRSEAWGRRPSNLNWICSRCHSGGRPYFAGGMAVWNSVEYADGVDGSCYVKGPSDVHSLPGLTCVHCHNPHQGIGRKWSKTPQQDDGKCLDCHKQFTDPAARLAHTHHRPDSAGDHCMDCHMPKIDEGLQDVVRTHRIFNPTEAHMIEANQPNACNLCHLQENIDWTLGYLRQWYPRTAGPYSEEKLNANYPDRKGAVALGWLKTNNEHTRLVAAEALAKANARWALPELLKTLDDPFIINRRFSELRLNEMLGTDLRKLGYHFYQLPAERVEPLKKIRQSYLDQAVTPAGQ